MKLEILLIIATYLIGSIPTGLLLGKAAGIDVRASGSGNIGATNVYRTVGRKLGIMTLVGDCFKGLLPVIAAQQLGLSAAGVALVGLAAFIGHVYTIFLGFKGGKGVATALGVFLGISPLSVLGALAVFIVTVAVSRYISLGSILAAAVMPFIVCLRGSGPEVSGITLVIALLVIWKHRSNIVRLLDGTENRFKA